MKESFIFYRSFYDAIEDLDDKKRLKMYDSIVKLALKNEENENLNGICKQLFILIKPQITANNKRYEDGKKGGRPKKEKTSGFFEKKPNENENENENVNVNVNENVEVLKKEKKLDPFFENSIIQEFQKNYLKIFNCKAFLSANQRLKLMELNADITNFKETIPIALGKLKEVNFDFPNFTPTANWLLKEDNYTAVLNGAYDKKKDKFERYREEVADDG